MSAMADMVALVEGVAPVADPALGGFVEMPTGRVDGDETILHDRAFTIVEVGVAGDGGIANADNPLKDEDWQIAIVYPLGPGVDEAAVRARAAADANALLNQLGLYNIWSGTDIDTLMIGHEQSTIQVLDNPGGRPALLLSIPIHVQFYGIS